MGNFGDTLKNNKIIVGIILILIIAGVTYYFMEIKGSSDSSKVSTGVDINDSDDDDDDPDISRDGGDASGDGGDDSASTTCDPIFNNKYGYVNLTPKYPSCDPNIPLSERKKQCNSNKETIL